MKFFLAILVISVALMCTQSKKPDLPWGLTSQHLTTRKIAGFTGHMIQRKQATDENEDRCNAELNRLACQTGFFEEAVEVLTNCGANEEAEESARSCDRNEAGEYCGKFDSGSDVVSTARSRCSTSISSSCTTECTDALQSIRNDLGCCINTVFNTTSNSEALFDYSLWLKCGVETVGECERTITVTPIHNNRVCTDTELTRRALTVQCSARINSIVDGAQDIGGCDDFVSGIMDQCRVNAQGEFCALVFTTNGHLDPSQECVIGQQGCPDICRMALEAVRTGFGCCINEVFNRTTSQQDPTTAFLTSYALWRECNVETPPTSCPVQTGGSVGLMLPNDSLITKLLFLLTFMMVTMWNM